MQTTDRINRQTPAFLETPLCCQSHSILCLTFRDVAGHVELLEQCASGSDQRLLPERFPDHVGHCPPRQLRHGGHATVRDANVLDRPAPLPRAVAPANVVVARPLGTEPDAHPGRDYADVVLPPPPRPGRRLH